MGLALLVAGVSALVVTSVALTACLRLATATSFVLGSFVVGWTVLVLETTALSLLEAWTRGAMLAVLVLGAAASLGLWLRSGRPRPPVSGSLDAVREALGDRVVAVLAVATSIAFAYLVVLGIVVPPGN